MVCTENHTQNDAFMGRIAQTGKSVQIKIAEGGGNALKISAKRYICVASV